MNVLNDFKSLLCTKYNALSNYVCLKTIWRALPEMNALWSEKQGRLQTGKQYEGQSCDTMRWLRK